MPAIAKAKNPPICTYPQPPFAVTVSNHTNHANHRRPITSAWYHPPALAGADAVYFGLVGSSARARAKNFDPADLPETVRFLHGRGVRGYVALNTLMFDTELARLESQVRACADAAVDAVIVQDLGAMQVVRAIAPIRPSPGSQTMPIASAGSAPPQPGIEYGFRAKLQKIEPLHFSRPPLRRLWPAPRQSSAKRRCLTSSSDIADDPPTVDRTLAGVRG